MDRSWMTKSRVTEEYQNGLKFFLDFSFNNASISDKILCPCKRCKIGIFVSRDDAYEHLIVDGFIPGYTQWIAHGELSRKRSRPENQHENQHGYPETSGYVDDMQGLIHDVFRVPQEDGYMQDRTCSPRDTEIANGQAGEFYKLIDSF
ncbi:hypothetical protein C2S51_037375 [Perilla frutescens var. frutescens]|nr:hypothetical protein C2S51_037375 [Perilla frutescens var. frutescens]